MYFIFKEYIMYFLLKKKIPESVHRKGLETMSNLVAMSTYYWDYSLTKLLPGKNSQLLEEISWAHV